MAGAHEPDRDLPLARGAFVSQLIQPEAYTLGSCACPCLLCASTYSAAARVSAHSPAAVARADVVVWIQVRSHPRAARWLANAHGPGLSLTAGWTSGLAIRDM